MRLALVCLVLAIAPAQAHDLRPGILAFVEDAPGELRMRFVPPVDSRGETQELPLVLPRSCTQTADRVRCTDGFTGELAVGGMRGHAMKIYVSLVRGGERREWVLTSEAPRITIEAPPRGPIPFAHLALFAALLLAWPRRPDVALTFIGAHVAAGLIGAGIGIELGVGVALIALAAMFAAREAIAPRMRWPTVAAAVFGMLAANPKLGLVGLELLLVLLVTVAIRLIGERRVVDLRAHRAAAYALGALASYLLLAELASR